MICYAVLEHCITVTKITPTNVFYLHFLECKSSFSTHNIFDVLNVS